MAIKHMSEAAAPTSNASAPAPWLSDAEADRLYATHGKPLEAEHWGKFLAVSRDGQTMLGDDLYDLTMEASETFGPQSIVFKVGEVTVWSIRCLHV